MSPHPRYLGFVAALLGVGCATSARAEEFQGKVVGVADGDTITVLRDQRPVKIRFEAVDAPEKDQPFGTQAKLFTSGLVFAKSVTVRVATTDKYGRTVGWVFVEGKSVNEALLRAGLAWHYTHYNKSPALARLEAEAKAARRGLWADASPTPPWNFRRAKRGQGPAPEATPASRPGRSGADPTRTPVPSAVGPLHGNTRAKVFHRPGCSAYACKHCTVLFRDEAEAVKAGYRACGQCGRGARPAGRRGPETACRVDVDCVLEPLDACRCPPCGVHRRGAVNRAAYAAILKRQAARGACRALGCPRCLSQTVGDAAVCVSGQCTTK